MKIAIALQVQKALSAEIQHLRGLETQNAWSFRSMSRSGDKVADAEWAPNFDFEENHKRILQLSRLHTKLGQAISKTNLEADVIGIEDSEYKDWA
jgi:hypothetical protein